MIADPLVRADGRCALPGCPNRLRKYKPPKKEIPLSVGVDPFCSTECCKAFHEVPLYSEKGMHMYDERAPKIARHKNRGDAAQQKRRWRAANPERAREIDRRRNERRRQERAAAKQQQVAA